MASNIIDIMMIGHFAKDLIVIDGQSFTLRSQWASESETLHILTVRLG